MDTNRTFQFQKRSQFFIGMHDKALTVAAVCISNPEATLRLARDDGLVDPIYADAKEQDLYLWRWTEPPKSHLISSR